MVKKKVVYLFGAGATQGEIQFVDDSIKLLAANLSEGMIKKIDNKSIRILRDVKNELTSSSDVEHLITLYGSIGTPKHDRISKKLKVLFREEILERLEQFEILHEDFNPTLLPALIDMHNVNGFGEK